MKTSPSVPTRIYKSADERTAAIQAAVADAQNEANKYGVAYVIYVTSSDHFLERRAAWVEPNTLDVVERVEPQASKKHGK